MSKLLGAKFWCQCCYIVSCLMVFTGMLICLFCILFGFFLTIKHTIDYNYWYNYQYKPKSNSPHPFWSVHSFSPFLLTSPYNLTILQPISKSSRLHKTRFYFTHWASSCILAICFLYHSKLLSGESIGFWFRFVARLLRPWSHTPYDTFYNNTI